MYTLTEPPRVKLIILYIIKYFGEPIDNGQITDIFMTHEFVDYFTMQQYLDELVEMKLVSIGMRENRRYYVLSTYGEDAYKTYIGRVPLTVREKLLASIRDYKKKLKSQSDVSARMEKINELEYAVDIEIREGGFLLMETRLTVGSVETAQEAVRRFKEDPQKVYKAVLDVLVSE